MSHLAAALTHALEALDLTQTAFAERGDLTSVQVNRAARGTVAVGRNVVSRIVRALPAPHNGQVLAAWLRDETPEDLRSLVDLLPTGCTATFTEPPADYGPPLDETRAELLRWVRIQIINTEFCDLLESLRAAIQSQ